MKIHFLKTVQPFFSEVKSGAKEFELRRNDRDFQVGDEVVLQEYDAVSDKFTGFQVWGLITYVLKDCPGIEDGFCIFSFKTTHRLWRP